ncbi:MAG: methyltransferase [Vicinamibacterales bacterium]
MSTRRPPLAAFAPSSRGRLTEHDLGRFTGATLFDRIARAVCAARCLPRKELYEAWEMARRVRRVLRGGRIVDLGAGHGLLGQIMLLLDASSPSALLVDPVLPASAAKVHAALAASWPRLSSRVTFVAAEVHEVALEPTDVVVSCHACGGLTDRILERAIDARARVAVLPCCHDVGTCVTGELTGWMERALAIDVERVHRLRQAGYRVRTQAIPSTITPKNRLLVGAPPGGDGEAET